MANEFDNQVAAGGDELDFRPLPAQRTPAPRGAAPPPATSASAQPKWGAYAKPGPYSTTLKPEEEEQFQGWVKQNKVPWTDSPTADYDMRGYWKAQQSGDKNAAQARDPNDNRMHFPDTFKTPYHETFSNESRYALPTAPRWKGDQLVDSASGKVFFDDSKQHDSGKPQFAAQGQDGIDFRPASAPGQRSPSTASQPQETISAYKPTLLRRIENVFTEGVPRYSSRTVNNPKYGQMQIVSPEEEMTPGEQREHPILTGVGEVAGGMTSPQNVAILAASGGLGSLPGAAGRILPRLVSAGFSAQMALDAYRQVPEFKAALDRGDTSEAMRIGTHIAASGVMSYFAGRHALAGAPAVGASTSAQPVEQEPTAVTLAGEPQAAAARIRPILALPPAESIGGEPIRTRLAASAQPLITPEATRTAAGAILTRGSPLSNRPALPEARGPEPDEVSDFLSGRSAAVPPLRSLQPRGVVEMAAPGAIRPLRTITVEPTQVTTEPPGQRTLSLTGTANEVRGDLRAAPATEAAAARIRAIGPPQGTLSLTGTAEDARGNLRPAAAAEAAPAQIRAINRGVAAPESAAPRLNAFGEPMPEGTAAAARTKPVPKPEWPSAEMKRAANLTFGQLRRDPVEQQYARDVWSAMLDRERSPEPPYGMPLARARSIQSKLGGIATGEGLPSALNPDPRTSGEFKPDELDAAHQRLVEANSMLQQATPPGRYEKVEESGERGTGEWYGVNSLRTMFPWFAEMKETPAELARAIERKQGPAYHRLLQSAAEYELSSRQATRNIVQSVAPDIDQLVEQVRGIDPEIAQILADAGAGKLGVFDGSLSRAREWAERNIDDARQLANLSGAIDELADAHHAEPAGAASAEESSRAAGGSREEAGVLPGLSQAVREQREATGRETARQLTEQINRPPESFESAAGEMERTSPLFRGTEASPQREIFGAKPEAPTTNFSSSARAQAASTEAPKGPEWLEGERQHEIARLNRILRNPQATPEETAIARQQLAHYETAAGSARTPPSETGSTTLYSGIDPTRVTAAARLLSRAWQDRVAQPFIDRVLRIGDKYQKARAADPAVAEGLHLLDNAPQYLRQKAAQNIHDIIGGLSREQERLFTLMADADARENLRANHPDEYRQAQSDPAIQEAMRKYRPIERDLTATRGKLGGDVLDQDYLRRIYDKYVAGVGKEQAPGSPERATSAFDRVIRPQRIGTMSREASAEYHYQNGLHEFGPALATKFIGTNLRALRDTVAKDFLSKAATLPAGAPEPRFILYNGERYYRPDVAADMPKGTKVYDRYDPTAGEKFPQPVEGKFLGPRDVVRALNDYGRRDEADPGALRRFFQEQVIGFGFGVPHIANIMRRVTQNVPGGALNPRSWASAWDVAFGKELRARGIRGLDDPTFDKLAQQGAISTGEMAQLKEYIGGNLNPANWLRSLAQVGHRVLYEPGAAGGFGGIDQRARLWLADLVQAQRPDLSDEQVGRHVRDALGDYNRTNWSDQQKTLSRFMLFPGWDFSSARWVLQHPIRATVPGAALVWLANQALHKAGANRAEDQNDVDVIRVGDRAISTGLLREPMARNLFRPFIDYANAKLQGANDQRAQAAAARGVTGGAGSLLGMLRPDLSAFIALATNRQNLVSGKEIVSEGDDETPGKILPTRAIEKQAVFTVRHAVPALDRMLDAEDSVDLPGFAGGNLSLPNYRDDAERRLMRNEAEATQTWRAVTKLAKSDPAKARDYMRDPDNAAYALFHRDFAQAVAALDRLDRARDEIENSRASDEEKAARLRTLDANRQTLLGHADALNNLLFERRQQPKPQPAPARAPLLRPIGASPVLAPSPMQ